MAKMAGGEGGGTSLPRAPRRGTGPSLRYQRCNHLGLQVFLGLTLTHIYTTEVLFYMPAKFPIRVLFCKGKILILNWCFSQTW